MRSSTLYNYSINIHSNYYSNILSTLPSTENDWRGTESKITPTTEAEILADLIEISFIN